MLTETREEKRLALSQTFLRRYENEVDDLWKHAVIGDETFDILFRC